MARTVLQIIQAFARKQGLPQPSYAVGSSDGAALQMLGLLEDLCDDLATRSMWQSNQLECTFVSTAAEDQGNIYTLAPGYRQMVPRTLFNRTQHLEIPFSMDPQEWNSNKAFGMSGPLAAARLRGDRLLFSPALAVSQTIAFEYCSENFVNSTDNLGAAVVVKYPSKDSDTFRVNDAIASAYLKWAWREVKGLEFAEAFRVYESTLLMERARQKAQLPANLSNSQLQDLRPGIVVSPGSWPLP